MKAAVTAFIGLLTLFAVVLYGYRTDIERWARRDLALRAQLAAETLAEPIETQDFRRIGILARHLNEQHGLRLTVYSPQGGILFRNTIGEGAVLRESAASGAFAIELAVRQDDILRPFRAALVGYLLAALVGVVGMSLVFFTLYRQRLRIRELARLERFRRDFIADFSHELKTPLTGILGAVDLMEDSDLQRLARQGAHRLADLADAMLSLSRLEEMSEASLVREPVGLRALVDEVCQGLRLEAERRAIALIVETTETDFSPRFNRDMVQRALTNLIANALRHSGGTRVTISWTQIRHRLTISVTDDGCGIPEAERTRIFERFYRLDASRTTPGTGLGLAIARSVAHLHGGDLVFEPVTPHGARFLLSLTIR